MKKILLINTTIDKGGAARVANDLFENLGSDFDIHFAYGRKTKSPRNKSFYFGNKIEFLIHLFLVRFFGLEGFGSYFSTRKLIRFIEKEKFDLINLHNLHGYYLNFFLLLDFLKKSEIPIIYSLHDEWPITWMPAHSIGCNHCKTGVGACSNTYGYPKNYFPLFTKYMLNRKRLSFSSELNMTIVCPSAWLTENIKQSFLNIFEVKTIHNGVDTNFFKPSIDKNALKIKYNLPSDNKIILFSASNLKDKSKGVQYILESAELLQEKKYLFLGLGNGNINQRKNVRTTGYIYDKKALAEMYSLSDLFCFASNAETFLLSAAEALSCTTPVVGFDIPVVRELVHDTVGILTKKDSSALACSIDKLLTDENVRIKMGKNGRDLIVKNYSKDIFYLNYKNLYNQQ